MEIIDFDPKSSPIRTGVRLCRRKNKISSKIKLKRVFGNVFDLQYEFRDNRTRFGGFMKKIVKDLFGHFWGRLVFDPTIFAKKCLFGVEIYHYNITTTLILDEEPEQNGPGTIC